MSQVTGLMCDLSALEGSGSTTVLLVRHAMCDAVGRWIAGRASGVHLNQEGRRQATLLAKALGGLPLEAVYSSPLERAIETAEPLAGRLGVTIQPVLDLIELDFGEWTGRTLQELEPLPLWQAWNRARGSARIPGGECMADVVDRACRGLELIRKSHPGRMALAVTHGDVIRGVLVHLLGMPLDLILRVEVNPASVSVLRFDGSEPRIAALMQPA